MPVILKDNVSDSLATPIAAADTGIVVRNGNLFPPLAAGEYFYATLVGADGSREIIRVTARSGNGLAVVRGQEGTLALPFPIDSRIEMRVTAASVLDAAQDAADAVGLSQFSVTASAAEINILDGALLSTAELNILDGVTATTAEINILDGVTATAAEINILDGVTATTAEINILDGVTASTAEINILDGVTATTAQLNQLATNTFTTGAFGSGTGASPSITFSGDLNSGIFSSGADSVSISTAGLRRLTVSPAGNVDIAGISTESKVLQVGYGRSGDGASYVDLVGDATYTDYGARFVRGGGANGNTTILHRGTGGILLTAQEAGPIVFSTTNLERARIHASGGVSIGNTTDPGATNLSVTGTVATGTVTNAGNLTVSTTGPNIISLVTNNVARQILWPDGVLFSQQGTPTVIAAPATLTTAQLATGIIQYTGAVGNLTLPLGTALDAYFSLQLDMAFDFSIINTSAAIVTVAVNTGVTSIGALATAAGTSSRWRLRRTAANTWIIYRL